MNDMTQVNQNQKNGTRFSFPVNPGGKSRPALKKWKKQIIPRLSQLFLSHFVATLYEIQNVAFFVELAFC